MADPRTGWYGVDLDGTLAIYQGWQGFEHIGEPIWPMMHRVKNWISQGKNVRIMTARVCVEDLELRAEVVRIIQDYTEKYTTVRLPVTHEKDFDMIEQWDDRARQVEFNTGRLIEDK
jgi:hypothetical protein